MRVQGQQERGTFLDDAHACVRMTVDASLVALGVLKPALQCEIVL